MNSPRSRSACRVDGPVVRASRSTFRGSGSHLSRSLFAIAFTLVTISALLSGCVFGNRSRGPAPPPGAVTTLTVQNESTSEVRIYAVSSGQRIRLGTVTGVRTERLTIPEHIVGNGRSLGFIAAPIAGRAVETSFTIYVMPGDDVRITIPSSVR